LTVELKPEQRFYAEQSDALATFISMLSTSRSVIFSVGAMITMFAQSLHELARSALCVPWASGAVRG
jgi:hypothetical protein